jgi:hypothetical protein
LLFIFGVYGVGESALPSSASSAHEVEKFLYFSAFDFWVAQSSSSITQGSCNTSKLMFAHDPGNFYCMH